MGTTGRCGRTLAGDADQAGPRPSRAAVAAPPAGRGGASIGLPVLAADDQCGRRDSREIRPAARLAQAHASTSSAKHLGVRPGGVVDRPGDRCGSCPAIHQQDPVPRQRRGVPGEFRSATPSRVQAGRGLVAAAGTGGAGLAHLIQPHLYRPPPSARCTCRRAIQLPLAVDYVRWGGAADGGSGRRDGATGRIEPADHLVDH